MMKRTQRALSMLMILCLMVSMLAALPVSAATGYVNVYGKTLAQIRVRAKASLSATIEDNIVRNACVYVLETEYLSSGETFVRVKYRDLNGDVATGWICQHDGKTEYVRILSTQDAKDTYKVSDGNLPSTRVGTMNRTSTSSESGSSSSNYGYLQLNSQGDAVRKLQTKLKELGYYSGSITGNFGELTEQAVKDYQKKNGLYVDGIAGPSTQAKIYATATSSTSSSSSSSSTSSSLLKLDASGDAVKTLQQNLKTLGFYTAEVTGHFGEKTEAAVKAFQKKYGLTQDGVAGSATLAKIASVLSSSSSSSSSTSNDSILKLNATGERVKQLQTDLTTLGLYTAEITGNFGEKTEAAVKAFQKKYGLTQDGIAGSATLAKIAALLQSSSSSSSSSTSTMLKLNSEGADVRNLQINLQALGYYTASITGHYGEKTQAAVKAFQQKNGLTADGIAGSATLQKIASLVSGSSSSSSSSTLKYGSEGELVKQLQQKLIDLKLYSGDVTGHYGYKTVAAVKSYQEKNGLTADGIAGKETLTSLGLTGSSSDSSTAGSSVTLTSNYGITVKDKVIVRSYYTTSSSEKTRLAKDTYFKILSTHVSGSYTWLRIQIGSTTGYLRSDMARVLSAAEAEEYLNNSSSGSTDEDSHDEAIGMIIVTGSTVNLRASAGTSGAYIAKATKDSVYSYVTTQSVDGVLWYKLNTGAWICGTYCRKMTDDEVKEYQGNLDNSGYYTLRYDMDDDNLVGTPIQNLQTALKNMKIYTGEITGHYGTKTVAAVKAFQTKYGLMSDGVAGAETQKKIAEVMNGSGVSDASIAELTKNTVYNIPWDTFKANAADFGYGTGKTAVIYDIQTGLSFRVKCQSNGLHSDVEPLTAADTNTMLKIYNVTSYQSITYVRRQVLLITSEGYGFAGSIYGQCHGSSTISDNNYPGQFCLHLQGSKVHVSGNVDADHQNCVSLAASWAQSHGYTLLTSYSK